VISNRYYSALHLRDNRYTIAYECPSTPPKSPCTSAIPKKYCILVLGLITTSGNGGKWMRIGMISIRDNFDTRDYHDQSSNYHEMSVPKQGRNEPGPPRKLAERCLEGEQSMGPRLLDAGGARVFCAQEQEGHVSLQALRRREGVALAMNPLPHFGMIKA